MKYECMVCGFVYNSELGCPDEDVPEGTAFADLSEDWLCPGCGADKKQFKQIKRED